MNPQPKFLPVGFTREELREAVNCLTEHFFRFANRCDHQKVTSVDPMTNEGNSFRCRECGAGLRADFLRG